MRSDTKGEKLTTQRGLKNLGSTVTDMHNVFYVSSPCLTFKIVIAFSVGFHLQISVMPSPSVVTG